MSFDALLQSESIAFPSRLDDVAVGLVVHRKELEFQSFPVAHSRSQRPWIEW